MIYTLQKRHEFGCGTMSTHFEVISYDKTLKGHLINARVLKKGTKAQCEKYVRLTGIKLEEV